MLQALGIKFVYLRNPYKKNLIEYFCQAVTNYLKTGLFGSFLNTNDFVGALIT